jgi:hypothetical protein
MFNGVARTNALSFISFPSKNKVTLSVGYLTPFMNSLRQRIGSGNQFETEL